MEVRLDPSIPAAPYRPRIIRLFDGLTLGRHKTALDGKFCWSHCEYCKAGQSADVQLDTLPEDLRTDTTHKLRNIIGRMHARIHLVDGTFVLEGVGVNLTSIDDKAVKVGKRQPLVDGCTVIFGCTATKKSAQGDVLYKPTGGRATLVYKAARSLELRLSERSKLFRPGSLRERPETIHLRDGLSLGREPVHEPAVVLDSSDFEGLLSRSHARVRLGDSGRARSCPRWPAIKARMLWASVSSVACAVAMEHPAAAAMRAIGKNDWR